MSERTSTYYFWLGLLIIFTICVLFFRDIRMALLYSTVYPPGFTNAKFEKVVVGDSYESVFGKVGPPLRYTIFSETPGLGSEWIDFSSKTALDSIVMSEHKEIVLAYSKPKRDKSYQVFEISFRDMKVVEKRSYTYWD